MSQNKILIIEDGQRRAYSIKPSLRKNGYSVLSIAETGDKASHHAENYKPDLVMINIQQNSETDSIETAILLRNQLGTPIIFLSAQHNNNVFEQVLKAEPNGYITPPFTEAQLLATIEIALYKNRKDNELMNVIKKLEVRLRHRRLHGMIPICSYCKNIRDDSGFWFQIEEYIRDHSEADFTHGICPTCMEKNYPEFSNEINC